MANRIMIAQAIARDQTSVAETIQSLLTSHGSVTPLDVEITKFGANQFLIVILFYGFYTYVAQSSLVASISRLFGFSRGASVSTVLTPVMDKLLGKLKAGVVSTVLSASMEYEVTYNRGQASALSLLSSVEEEDSTGE